MRLRFIATSLTFLVTFVAGAIARQASPAQLALEAARNLEVVDRNLPAAIVQYRDVAAKYESDAAVAPTALFRLAGCYEQLGQPEARATYEFILKHYPDSTVANAARAKLTAAQREPGLSTTQLALWAVGGAPSPDGRYLTGIDPLTSDLAVRDLKSGKIRRITAIAKKSPFDFPQVMNSVPSQDGTQIAFAWRPNADEFELRTVDYAGRQERVLCCRQSPAEAQRSAAAIEVFGWSGDGKHILFETSSSKAAELMTVPAAGGTPRVLMRLKEPTSGAGWSPDGQFIVYDAREGQARERDLFIMRADGSGAEPLITHGANDRMLHWFPDGKRILFLSDRYGSDSVLAQSIVAGKAVGEPLLVKTLVGTFRGNGFTRDGSYYFDLVSPKEEVYTTRFDASGALVAKAEPLPSRFEGGKAGGVWSADGSRIAYVRWAFGGPPESSISIQTISTQEVRTIPVVELKTISSPAWMPDGRAIVVAGNSAKGQGLFRIELSSGAVSVIGELSTGSIARDFPVVSPDGREVFYAVGGGSDGSRFRGVQAQDLASGALRTVFDGPLGTFALSPDGRFIVIASPGFEPVDQVPVLRIVPSAGGQARAIGTEVPPGTLDTGLAWSADGRYVFFARPTSARRIALWRIPVSGGTASHADVPRPNQFLLRISVRPDGLLAISTHENHVESWVMRNIPPAAKR